MHKSEPLECEFDERLKVIRKIFSRCDELKDAVLNQKLKGVAEDDILDALVAAVTARFGFDAFKTIPTVPEYDEEHIQMEMVYCLSGSTGFLDR